MNKTLKKIISFILALVAASTFALTTFAEESSIDTGKYPTGLLAPEEWELWHPEMSEPVCSTAMLSGEIKPYDTGDVNGDCKITAEDARSCLRACAKLETLSYEADNAAHVFNHWSKLTAADARAILRAAAKLDIIYKQDCTIEYGKAFEVYDLLKDKDGKYNWDYSCVRSEELEVKTESFELSRFKYPDESVTQPFLFLPKDLGTYVLRFMLIESETGKCVRDVFIKVTVAAQNERS